MQQLVNLRWNISNTLQLFYLKYLLLLYRIKVLMFKSVLNDPECISGCLRSYRFQESLKAGMEGVLQTISCLGPTNPQAPRPSFHSSAQEGAEASFPWQMCMQEKWASSKKNNNNKTKHVAILLARDQPCESWIYYTRVLVYPFWLVWMVSSLGHISEAWAFHRYRHNQHAADTDITFLPIFMGSLLFQDVRVGFLASFVVSYASLQRTTAKGRNW